MNLVAPKQSFIQFDETGVIQHCLWDNLAMCLPVINDDDIAFQAFIQGTEEELDTICGPYGIPVRVGIVSACDDADFLIEFSEQPEIFRLGAGQLLMNWSHGLPGFAGQIDLQECFRIRVQIGATQWCSNCLERVSDDCFTSVIEYGCDDNCFGFNYCNSGEIVSGEDTITCEPTIIQFVNQSSITIPYTTSLRDKYGDAPQVQVWISDGTNLVNMGIEVTFDAFPVNTISADFGGPATGILVIR